MTIGEGKGKLLKKFPLPLSKPLPSSSNIFVFIESLPPSFPDFGVMPMKNSKLMPGIGRDSTER